MTWALWLAASAWGAEPVIPSREKEIGVTRRFGAGIAAGIPSSVTLKVQADPRNGVALHVGSALATPGLHLRLQFEQAPLVIDRFEFGDLFLTWHTGTVVNVAVGELVTTSGIRWGVTAGVGAELRPGWFPVSLFGEASLIVFPLDFVPGRDNPLAPIEVGLVVGARFFFGSRGPRPPTAPPLPAPPTDGAPLILRVSGLVEDPEVDEVAPEGGGVDEAQGGEAGGPGPDAVLLPVVDEDEVGGGDAQTP